MATNVDEIDDQNRGIRGLRKGKEGREGGGKEDEIRNVVGH